MNPRVVFSLVRKDLSVFFRNRFFAVITLLGLVAYVGIYFVMPRSADSTLQVGLYMQAEVLAFGQLLGEGLELQRVDSEDALREGVTSGRFIAGLALPPDASTRLLEGGRSEARIFFAADTPQEIREAIALFTQELGQHMTGQDLPVKVSEETLGPNLAGAPLLPRERLRPLLAVMLILVETMGLATLISEEIERRTIQALLVTPATAADVFAAKGIAGIGLAFGQAALFMAIVGGLAQQPLVVLTALLLGAVLVIMAGFIIGAVAKDMLSVLAWSMPVIILLILPSVGVALPGSISGWVKVLPSYYMVDTVHRASNFGAGWGDVWRSLLALACFDLTLAWFGVVFLRRRTR